MKIQIDDQIHDIDEETFRLWLRVGSIPVGTFIQSETLTGGRWTPIHELDWSNEQDRTQATDESHPFRREFEKEKQFLSYQRRLPIVTLVLISLNTIIFILLDQFVGRSQDVANLIRFGAYSYPLIVQNGEYWRLITNTFLHIGSFHFLLNMGILFILGNLLEGLYGRSRFIILYLISAIGGSLASLIFVRAAIGAGASGAIFGLMGVVVALGLQHRDRLPLRRGRVFGLRLLPFIVLDVVLGFIIPHINIAAHLGGLLVGFSVGLVLPPAIYADGERESYGVKAAAAVFVGLTVLSGAVTIQRYFDRSGIAERRANDGIRSTNPSAELSEYIDRIEETVRSRGYTRELYGLLERMYWDALRTDPENPSWVQRLQEFYERALLEEPNDSNWNEGFVRLYLYQVEIVGQRSETEYLSDYIGRCVKVKRKKGYHENLYRNLEFFYTRGKELNPDQISGWNDDLEKLYREAITGDPEYANWYNNLAWLYVEQKSNSERAVELARQAVKRDAKNPTMLDTLAWAYLQNAQYRKSLRTFEQVLAIRSDTNEDQLARESSWDGVSEWVRAEVSPSESAEHAQDFEKFYAYMSRQFTNRPAEQAKLDVAFEQFQANHH